MTNVFARRITGCSLVSSMKTNLVLDPLVQALYVRQPRRTGCLIHHGDLDSPVRPTTSACGVQSDVFRLRRLRQNSTRN